MLCSLLLCIFHQSQDQSVQIFHYPASSEIPNGIHQAYPFSPEPRYRLVPDCTFLPESAFHRLALVRTHRIPQMFHYQCTRNSRHRTPYRQVSLTALLLCDASQEKSLKLLPVLLLYILHQDKAA